MEGKQFEAHSGDHGLEKRKSSSAATVTSFAWRHLDRRLDAASRRDGGAARGPT